MQTAAISYRVADFLKQHPPFDSMTEEDLLTLAGRGRVKFHESDEHVCWRGEPHGSFVFVIQQGSVSLWEEAGEGERLTDLRGPGDMLGQERFLGEERSPYSARTNGDVVLYALDARDFEPLIRKYPQAGRYLASHASVSAELPGSAMLLSELRSGAHPPVCQEAEPIREAARRMAAAGAAAIAVEGPDGAAAGVVTAARLVRWLAEGDGDTDAAAGSLIDETATVAREHSTITECVLAMAAGSGVVITTRDGTPRGGITGVLTGADLVPALGEDPAAITAAIRTASGPDVLRRLNQRARAFLLGQLDSPASVEWLAGYAHIVDTAIVRRAIELVRAGGDDFCWCFYGAAGRAESLTPVMPQVALVSSHEDAPAAYGRVQDLLAHCGYVARQERGEIVPWGTAGEWRKRFEGWISSPILNRVSQARPLFDLRPVQGSTWQWDRLADQVRAQLCAEPGFTLILANDCLESLPPLTFFRDLVVEESGEQTGLFRLERSALRPLVDVGRVFGVAAGTAMGTSTTDRLRLACGIAPAQEAVFREAVETLWVVLFHQARAGIRQHGEGFDLPASQIGARERAVLKGGFRSILRLLETVSEFDWMEAR
jgi:CBS domain-containing protein